MQKSPDKNAIATPTTKVLKLLVINDILSSFTSDKTTAPNTTGADK